MREPRETARSGEHRRPTTGTISGGTLAAPAQAVTAAGSVADRLDRARRLGHRPADLGLGRDTSRTVRRYRVTKAPEDGEVYSISDDASMVTGMATPNHVLLVDDAAKIKAINKAIRDSPLETYPREKVTRLDRDYLSVGLRFKVRRRRDEASRTALDPSFRDLTETTSTSATTNLDALFREGVAPHMYQLRQEILAGQTAKVKSQADNYKELAGETDGLVKAFELYRKLMASEIANLGEWSEDVALLGEVGRRFAAIVGQVLAAKRLTRSDVGDAIQALLELWFDEPDEEPATLIAESASEVLNRLKGLRDALPKDAQIDMRALRGTLFQASQLDSLNSEDAVLLYRACDVMASTLLGNRVTPENKDRLKSYTSGGDAGHYATRVLASNGDWISLEAFAMSEEEREVSGLGESILANLDNTWQFIMQGSTQRTVGDQRLLSDEDRYFEFYTRLRYLMKGIEQQEGGGFNPTRRTRASKPAYEKVVNSGLSGALMNPTAWEFLAGGMRDEEDRVIDELNKFEETWALYEMYDPAYVAQQLWDQVIKKIG